MKQATRFTLQQGGRVLINDLQLDPRQLLLRAGLPADMFNRTDASLSVEEYFNLWHALEHEAAEKIPATPLPLAIGEAMSVEAFDPPIFASLCSPNLNVGLTRLSQFKRLIGPLTLSVDQTERDTRATVACYGYSGKIPRSLGLTELVFLTQLTRMATRTHVMPLEVTCSHLADDMAPYEAYFGVEVTQGQENTIRFAAADAQRPFITENTAMWSFFQPELQRRLSDLDTRATTAQRVKSVLLEMLPSGQSAIEQAAARLALSKRTLQRKLSSESTNFQAVLGATRSELARYYLLNSRLSPGEIAFLLGFQDTNSFFRSFSRWTGQTPEQYRSSP